MLLNPSTPVNGSLEVTVQYMVQAAEWIDNILKQSNEETVPFQFDLCFAFGEPFERHNDSNDQSDDEDMKEQEPTVYVDYVGNIEAKLKNNELKYSKNEINAKDGMEQMFGDLFQQFLSENKLKSDSYLRSKRLISMVDQRNQNNDTIFMYEPPDEFRDIPSGSDTVPEWFMVSSRQCLLPGLDVCSRCMFSTYSWNGFKCENMYRMSCDLTVFSTKMDIISWILIV